MGLRLKSNVGKDGLRKCKNNNNKQKARRGEELKGVTFKVTRQM